MSDAANRSRLHDVPFGVASLWCSAPAGTVRGAWLRRAARATEPTLAPSPPSPAGRYHRRQMALASLQAPFTKLLFGSAPSYTSRPAKKKSYRILRRCCLFPPPTALSPLLSRLACISLPLARPQRASTLSDKGKKRLSSSVGPDKIPDRIGSYLRPLT